MEPTKEMISERDCGIPLVFLAKELVVAGEISMPLTSISLQFVPSFKMFSFVVDKSLRVI